ncbi:MAG: phosphoribosyl-AMP cyclohydrolase [Candidatus Omnitrophota bacterium]
MKADSFVQEVKFAQDGLVPVIIQDENTSQVLMLAYMNAEALKKTLETGKTHFWSRSRQKAWFKGESSGHVQAVRAVYFDCDNDTLLIKVRQTGAACHNGYYSCFYRRLNPQSLVWEVIDEKIFDPQKVYQQ